MALVEVVDEKVKDEQDNFGRKEVDHSQTFGCDDSKN